MRDTAPQPFRCADALVRLAGPACRGRRCSPVAAPLGAGRRSCRAPRWRGTAEKWRFSRITRILRGMRVCSGACSPAERGPKRRQKGQSALPQRAVTETPSKRTKRLTAADRHRIQGLLHSRDSHGEAPCRSGHRREAPASAGLNPAERRGPPPTEPPRCPRAWLCWARPTAWMRAVTGSGTPHATRKESVLFACRCGQSRAASQQPGRQAAP